jgi:hypothetical protein
MLLASELLPAALPVTSAVSAQEVQKKAADGIEIPAKWLVHAGYRQAATGGATSFWRSMSRTSGSE